MAGFKNARSASSAFYVVKRKILGGTDSAESPVSKKTTPNKKSLRKDHENKDSKGKKPAESGQSTPKETQDEEESDGSELRGLIAGNNLVKSEKVETKPALTKKRGRSVKSDIAPPKAIKRNKVQGAGSTKEKAPMVDEPEQSPETEESEQAQPPVATASYTILPDPAYAQNSPPTTPK